MLSYIARRKHWWTTLQEPNGDIRVSKAMRANLLIELSSLSRIEQLMVETAARRHTVDVYPPVLVHRHSVVHMKERLLTGKTHAQGRGYKPWGRQPNAAPKYGYMGQRYGEDDNQPEYENPHGNDNNGDAYAAVSPAFNPDDDLWVDDEDEAMQLNA